MFGVVLREVHFCFILKISSQKESLKKLFCLNSLPFFNYVCFRNCRTKMIIVQYLYNSNLWKHNDKYWYIKDYKKDLIKFIYCIHLHKPLAFTACSVYSCKLRRIRVNLKTRQHANGIWEVYYIDMFAFCRRHAASLTNLETFK